MKWNERCNITPKFVFRRNNDVWHKMDEPSFAGKKEALARKTWLVEEYGKTGYRIIKHKGLFYLYERK